MTDNTTLVGGVTESMLDCRSADWALTATLGFLMIIFCFWQFKDELDYQIRPIVTLFFYLAISIHVYLDFLSSYFNDDVAEWIVWVLLTAAMAVAFMAAKRQWFALAVFVYVGLPGVIWWGKLSVTVIAAVAFFALATIPVMEKLLLTFSQSLMLVCIFLLSIITMLANAGGAGWPDNCLLNHYNGFIICSVPCGSVTTNNDMVHVWYTVGFALVLAIIRTAWIRWRPGEKSIDRNNRLYCCICCCGDVSVGEYDQLEAGTANNKNKKPKNIKRVSAKSSSSSSKKKGNGTTSESRGNGHIDHATEDINLAPLDDFVDDKRTKKKNKQKRSSRRSSDSDGDDDSGDDGKEAPAVKHEVKADDSHQFAIADTDHASIALEDGDDENELDLEAIVNRPAAAAAESKRSSERSEQPPNTTVVVEKKKTPPPSQQQDKEKEEMASLV